MRGGSMQEQEVEELQRPFDSQPETAEIELQQIFVDFPELQFNIMIKYIIRNIYDNDNEDLEETERYESAPD